MFTFCTFKTSFHLFPFTFLVFFSTIVSLLQISLLKQSLEMQLSQSQHSLQQLQAQFSQEREHLGQQLQEMELEHQRREQRLQEAHCCAIQDMQEARQHDLKVRAAKHNLRQGDPSDLYARSYLLLSPLISLLFEFLWLCSTSTLIFASDNSPPDRIGSV